MKDKINLLLLLTLILIFLCQQYENYRTKIAIGRLVYTNNVLLESVDVLFNSASSTRELLRLTSKNQNEEYLQFLDLYFKTDPDFLASQKKFLRDIKNK